MTLTPLPVSEWDASLAGVIDDMKGAPLNVHGLMAHNPALLKAWWSFRNHMVAGGALGPRRGELVILRVAVRAGAWYEWGSHVDRALRVGISLDEIMAVQDTSVSDDWNAAERDLLLAVDELTDRKSISADLLKRLSVNYSNSQVLDIMALHGMYATLASMIKTWRLELDEAVQTRLPETVTQGAFEDAVR